MTEPVRIDNKIGLLALIAAIISSVVVIYNVKTDIAVVQVQTQATKQDVDRLDAEGKVWRERVNAAIQELRISNVRIEAGSQRIEGKVDELLKVKR